MKLKKILAFALCLACFLTSSVFANSSGSKESIAQDSNSSVTQEFDKVG